ncbi:MAG: polysaccharide deacetylase family protein [Chloroflexota bacterium]
MTNSILRKLGLNDRDRVVIFHADDIGMCHASLAAYRDLIDFGLISSAATMVPCAWFEETAVYCRENQATYPHIDMGVHLTLTSEWANFRWRPLTTLDPASGLLDEAGYFHRTSQAVAEQANKTAVQHEINTQLDRALAAGIDVTHIDSHMGSIFAAPFLKDYIKLASENRLPALMLRQDEASFRQRGFDQETIGVLLRQQQALEASGFPILDHITMMSLREPEERLTQVKQAIDALPTGISYFIIHPSTDTPELRAIAPDWRCRVGDYETFTSEAVRRYVADSGVHVIGYRTLRNLMRKA